MEPKPHSVDARKSDTPPEWELGLPTADELPPLHQNLISPGLAAAFAIVPANYSTIFRREESGSDFEPLKLFPEKNDSDGFRLRRRVDSGDGAAGSDESNSGGDESGTTSRAVKRPRLVWTPQLHKRFVDVIERLGVDKAVPKVIMEMMNVEGLTRENVASHLQKYRLYLKKMEGNPTDVNSSSMSISTNASERHDTSAYQSCNGGFGAMQSSAVNLNSMAMMPLPSLVGVGYGGGQLGMTLATGGGGKGGFCGMESGGYGGTLWTRQKG